MPELPEVETTLRGLAPRLTGRRVTEVVLRRPDLRWPIPDAVRGLVGARIEQVSRRAKYLLMRFPAGTAIWHLGMSGSLRLVPSATPARPHDHVDWCLDTGEVLRFHDARRFGCLMFHPASAGPAALHPLLRELGPEPLSDAFDGAHLHAETRGRAQAIKHTLMDQRRVVGVGNIYAAEALFHAGVRPQRPAHSLSRAACESLAQAIKRTLGAAIERGGTTLRDFVNAEGEPGYFEQELFVYGREHLPCRVCASPVRAAALGARQSLYCPSCQK